MNFTKYQNYPLYPLKDCQSINMILFFRKRQYDTMMALFIHITKPRPVKLIKGINTHKIIWQLGIKFQHC